MLEIVVKRIKQYGGQITRQDIAEVLSSIDEPGKQRKLKERTIEKLYTETGRSPLNSQGHSVVDELSDWEQY